MIYIHIIALFLCKNKCHWLIYWTVNNFMVLWYLLEVIA